MEQLLEQIRELLGNNLFNTIMNPHTDRPYIFSSFKKRRVYTTLSGGEKALVQLAYDLYNGSGRSNLNHEDWQNLEFLESLLAHEFGHHYISFKLHDLSPEDEELAADFIAKDLVGLDAYTKALNKGLERQSDESHMSTDKRIEILNQYPENHILDAD